MPAHRINITDQRFGNLLALREAGTGSRGNVLWLCRCDCGHERIVMGSDLKSGKATHCGCLTSRNKRRAYGTQWMRQNRAAKKALRQPVQIKRPNNGPLDQFLYGHPAP
jgi:hypothetical protein